jgi:membrane protein YqaA with SNARE-associated domain
MIELITANGYLYLFLLSFSAATLIPLGSEWLLVALLMESLNPALLLFSATVGNFLGACTTYLIAIYCAPVIANKVLRMSDKSLVRSSSLYRTYGSWSLLLSWVPVIGDPLCFIGGIFKVPFSRFFVLVITGKFARYAFITAATLSLHS